MTTFIPLNDIIARLKIKDCHIVDLHSMYMNNNTPMILLEGRPTSLLDCYGSKQRDVHSFLLTPYDDLNEFKDFIKRSIENYMSCVSSGIPQTDTIEFLRGGKFTDLRDDSFMVGDEIWIPCTEFVGFKSRRNQNHKQLCTHICIKIATSKDGLSITSYPNIKKGSTPPVISASDFKDLCTECRRVNMFYHIIDNFLSPDLDVKNPRTCTLIRASSNDLWYNPKNLFARITCSIDGKILDDRKNRSYEYCKLLVDKFNPIWTSARNQ